MVPNRTIYGNTLEDLVFWLGGKWWRCHRRRNRLDGMLGEFCLRVIKTYGRHGEHGSWGCYTKATHSVSTLCHGRRNRLDGILGEFCLLASNQDLW
jgi:hypothetical protein